MSSLTVLVILLLNFYLEYQFHEIQTIYGFNDHIIFKIDLKEKLSRIVISSQYCFSISIQCLLTDLLLLLIWHQ